MLTYTRARRAALVACLLVAIGLRLPTWFDTLWANSAAISFAHSLFSPELKVPSLRSGCLQLKEYLLARQWELASQWPAPASGREQADSRQCSAYKQALRVQPGAKEILEGINSYRKGDEGAALASLRQGLIVGGMGAAPSLAPWITPLSSTTDPSLKDWPAQPALQSAQSGPAHLVGSMDSG